MIVADFRDIKNDFEKLQKSQKYEELEDFLRKHSLAKRGRLYYNINANDKEIDFRGYMDYLYTLRINDQSAKDKAANDKTAKDKSVKDKPAKDKSVKDKTVMQ